MTKEEWAAIPDEARPSVRLCIPVSFLDTPVADSTQEPCDWCSTLCWVDAAQEMPAEARKTGIIIVCSECIINDKQLGPQVLGSFFEVYEAWMTTGVIPGVEIEFDQGEMN